MKERRVGDRVYVGTSLLTPYHIMGISEEGDVTVHDSNSAKTLVFKESEVYATESLVKYPETNEPTSPEEQITLPPRPDEGKPSYPLGALVYFEVGFEGARLEVKGFVRGYTTTYTYGVGQGTPGYNYTVYSISELGCLRTKIWLVPKSSIKGLATPLT